MWGGWKREMASSNFGWDTESPQAFFFQFLYPISKTVPQIKPPPLPFQSFPIHYFLITILFDALQKQRLTVLLHKS